MDKNKTKDEIDRIYARIDRLEDDVEKLKRILCICTSISPIPTNNVTGPCTHFGVSTTCRLCRKEIKEGDYVNYYLSGNREAVIDHKEKLGVGAVHEECLYQFMTLLDANDEMAISSVFQTAEKTSDQK